VTIVQLRSLIGFPHWRETRRVWSDTHHNRMKQRSNR